MAENDRKRPWLAAALAMLSPGLGHVYLREWLRALMWFALILTTTSYLLPESPEPTALTIEAVLHASLAAAEQVPLRSQVALFAVTTLSMADAYWIATKGNERAEAAEGTACPHCGQELDEDLDFCHWCTSRLEPRE